MGPILIKSTAALARHQQRRLYVLKPICYKLIVVMNGKTDKVEFKMY